MTGTGEASQGMDRHPAVASTDSAADYAFLRRGGRAEAKAGQEKEVGSWRKEEKEGGREKGAWRGRERRGLESWRGRLWPHTRDGGCPPSTRAQAQSSSALLQDSVSPSAKWLVKGHIQLRERLVGREEGGVLGAQVPHLFPTSLLSSSLPKRGQGRGKGSQGWGPPRALPALRGALSPEGADTLLGNLSRTQLQC